MTRDQKAKVIDELTVLLNESTNIYLADTSGLDALQTSNLRAACYKNDVRISVVKNTLLEKALERSDKPQITDLKEVLKGNTALLIAEKGNIPARVIKDVRKKATKPLLKGAYIDEAVFIGDNQLEALVSLKSKEELIADILALLQSPVKNVISALQSGGNSITGVLKTLAEKSEK